MSSRSRSRPGPVERGPQHAARVLGAVCHPDPMTAVGQHAGRFQPRRSGADHEHLAGAGVSTFGRLVPRFVAAARLADTAHDRVPVVAHLAGLIAQQARSDASGEPVAHPLDQRRIRDRCAGHLDQIGNALIQCGLRSSHIHDAALEHDGHPAARGKAHLSAQLEVEAGRHVRGRPIGRRRKRAAAYDDQ